MMSAEFSILDFGDIPPGGNARDVIQRTCESARLAEALGYKRYWLAEHHGQNCAWGNPAIVAALLANATGSIRIGAGGLLFSLHNPLHVANEYSLLTSFFSGRIDLGLGRGTASGYAEALTEPGSPGSERDYSRRLARLLGYLLDIPRPQHLFADARRVPFGGAKPEVWLLGTGRASMLLASRYGLPFAFSLFHRTDSAIDIVDEYIARFRPGRWLSSPKLMIGISGVCTEARGATATQVEYHAKRGALVNLVGPPATWSERVSALAARESVVEFIYLNQAVDSTMQRDSYSLLAETFSLVRPA